MTGPTNSKLVTVDEAKIILEQETLQREKDCWKEIEQVLNKFNCRLSVLVLIQDGKLAQTVGVTSK